MIQGSCLKIDLGVREDNIRLHLVDSNQDTSPRIGLEPRECELPALNRMNFQIKCMRCEMRDKATVGNSRWIGGTADMTEDDFLTARNSLQA
jgi:hypothetical protein